MALTLAILEHPPSSASCPQEPLREIKYQMNTQSSKWKGKSVLRRSYEKYQTKRVTEIYMPHGTNGSFTKPESKAQDFYFCLGTRQKITLCASCGMTKQENKPCGGFGWLSCHVRLCVFSACVKAALLLIRRRILIPVEEDKWAERLFILLLTHTSLKAQRLLGEPSFCQTGTSVF